jgi:hypothetical protein
MTSWSGCTGREPLPQQSRGLLALIGLLVAAALPAMERRVAAYRAAGGALVLAAGGLVLLG